MDNIKQVVKDVRFLIATDCCDETIQSRIEDFINGQKQLPIHGVSNRRELLTDFLDDVLMCQDEGATIVDREKYVDGYLGN